MNFLKETIGELKRHNKKFKDVLWIGNNDFQITKEQFRELANYNYDTGYGLEEVPLDLLVVGGNWWMERHEYDGSEWWEFKKLPKKPSKIKILKWLIRGQGKDYFGVGDDLEDRL